MNIEKKVNIFQNWLEDKKAENIKFYEVSHLTDYTDYIIICTAKNSLHIKVLAEHLKEKATENGIKNLTVEGKESQNWYLIDAGDIVIHIFLEKARKHYNLSGLLKQLKERK